MASRPGGGLSHDKKTEMPFGFLKQRVPVFVISPTLHPCCVVPKGLLTIRNNTWGLEQDFRGLSQLEWKGGSSNICYLLLRKLKDNLSGTHPTVLMG